MGWQWHQLDHYANSFAPRSRQTTTPVPPPLSFYSLDALPATEPTVSKH